MTLDELKQLELPVTLKCHDGTYKLQYSKITVKGFNTKCMLISDSKGVDDYMFVSELKHFEVKKKEITIDFWVNVYENGFVSGTYCNKENADRARSRHRLDCINIKKTYEV